MHIQWDRKGKDRKQDNRTKRKYNNTGEVDIAELEKIDDALHNSVMDAALLPTVPRAWWHLGIENAFRL
eukprot:13791141-Ditylum_brightwellii.AAC.1